jgi:hypothetical protein
LEAYNIPAKMSVEHSSIQSIVIRFDELGKSIVFMVPVCIYFKEGCVFGHVVVNQVWLVAVAAGGGGLAAYRLSASNRGRTMC